MKDYFNTWRFFSLLNSVQKCLPCASEGDASIRNQDQRYNCLKPINHMLKSSLLHRLNQAIRKVTCGDRALTVRVLRTNHVAL